ncbi:MAG: glutathione S-transferase domain-containing protein, partial [Bradyrhizobium sp.]
TGVQRRWRSSLRQYGELPLPRAPLSGPAMFPVDAKSYGRMAWFDQFAGHFLGAAERKIVINVVFKPMRGEEADAHAAHAAMNLELPPQFDYLESQIREPFLTGTSFSLADLAVASPFASPSVAGHVLEVHPFSDAADLTDDVRSWGQNRHDR